MLVSYNAKNVTTQYIFYAQPHGFVRDVLSI